MSPVCLTTHFPPPILLQYRNIVLLKPHKLGPKHLLKCCTLSVMKHLLKCCALSVMKHVLKCCTPSVMKHLLKRCTPSVMKHLLKCCALSVMKHLLKRCTPSVMKHLLKCCTPSVMKHLLKCCTPPGMKHLLKCCTPPGMKHLLKCCTQTGMTIIFHTCSSSFKLHLCWLLLVTQSNNSAVLSLLNMGFMKHLIWCNTYSFSSRYNTEQFKHTSIKDITIGFNNVHAYNQISTLTVYKHHTVLPANVCYIY